MKIVFVGFEYPYGNKDFGKSLDVEIFVDSVSKVIGDNVVPFYIDKFIKKETSLNLNDELKQFCNSENPNLILFNLINDEIDKEMLIYLKDNYQTLNWFGDDQWRYELFASKMASYFSYYVTTDKFSVEKYKRDGHVNVILSQWGGVNLLDIDKINKIEYQNDFSFVGAYSPVREWIIEYLKSNGIHVNCYGFNWESGPIETAEMHNCFTQSKINLNLSNSVNNDIDFLKFNVFNLLKSFKNIIRLDLRRFLRELLKSLRGIKLFITYEKNSEQIKARNFEIPMAYGFQISNYALSLEDYLEIGQEISVFNSKEELLKLCRYYLNNEVERKKILHRSYLRSKEHTYENRFKSILTKLNML